MDLLLGNLQQRSVEPWAYQFLELLALYLPMEQLHLLHLVSYSKFMMALLYWMILSPNQSALSML